MSESLQKYTSEYKEAVKWLMETRTYKKEFHSEEWKSELERDLVEDSVRAFNEAGLVVLSLRKKIMNTRESLMNEAVRKRKPKCKMRI